MKRTFQFGLLGALISFFAILLVIFIYICTVIGIVLQPGSSIILPKFQSHIFVFLEKYFVELMVIFPIIGIIIVAWTAWKLNFINKQYVKFWIAIRNYIKTTAGNYTSFILRMSLIAILLVISYFVNPSNYLLDRVMFKYTNVSASFSTHYAGTIFWLPVLAPLVPLSFFIFSASYTITMTKSLYEFKKNLVVPVSGLAATIAVFLSAIQMQNYFDLNKTLKDIPGITLSSEPRMLTVLSVPVASYPIDNDFYDFLYSYNQDNGIPFNDANVKAIEKYLQEKKFTCLRAVCFSFLALNKIRELDTNKALEIYNNAFEKTNDQLNIIYSLRIILNGPTVEPYLGILKEFSDETKYNIRGNICLNISKAYAKFGDLQRAAYWYDKGVKTGSNYNEKYFEQFKLQSEPEFYKGCVSGKILCSNEQNEGVRVGIIKGRAVKSLQDANDHKYLSPLMDLNRIYYGAITDKDGRFSFNGLGEGEYVLLLSVKTPDNKTIKVLNSPGTITISKTKPSVDAGVIRLAY